MEASGQLRASFLWSQLVLSRRKELGHRLGWCDLLKDPLLWPELGRGHGLGSLHVASPGLGWFPTRFGLLSGTGFPTSTRGCQASIAPEVTPCHLHHILLIKHDPELVPTQVGGHTTWALEIWTLGQAVLLFEEIGPLTVSKDHVFPLVARSSFCPCPCPEQGLSTPQPQIPGGVNVVAEGGNCPVTPCGSSGGPCPVTLGIQTPAVSSSVAAVQVPTASSQHSSMTA